MSGSFEKLTTSVCVESGTVGAGIELLDYEKDTTVDNPKHRMLHRQNITIPRFFLHVHHRHHIFPEPYDVLPILFLAKNQRLDFALELHRPKL